MSKKIKLILTSILIVLFFLVLWGIYLYVSQPVLSESELIIYTGYSKTIYLKGRYDAKEWESENEDILVVEDGKITARSVGSTSVTVKAGDKKLVCNVEVKETVSTKFYEIAMEEKDWFFKQQLDNGAFCNQYNENGVVSISPYFSSLGIWCVLQCELNDNEKNKIKEYFLWHFKHINYEEDYNGLTGTIYDYKAIVEAGKVIEEYSEDKYDSTDSYAAVFLSALWKYYEKTGDAELLQENKEGIIDVTKAMLYTLNNNYTYCKPDYEIYYLMDNLEVYDGLLSVEKIFMEIFNDYEYGNEISKLIKNFEKNFDAIWWEENHYRYYLKAQNVDIEKFSWNSFYPDAVSQIYPIIYNIANLEKSNIIYSEFCDSWKWEEMDYFYSKEVDFYWGMLMYGAVKVKDYKRAEEYLDLYRQETYSREYPLILSECAWVTLGTEKMADYYKNLELSYAD